MRDSTSTGEVMLIVVMHPQVSYYVIFIIQLISLLCSTPGQRPPSTSHKPAHPPSSSNAICLICPAISFVAYRDLASLSQGTSSEVFWHTVGSACGRHVLPSSISVGQLSKLRQLYLFWSVVFCLERNQLI